MTAEVSIGTIICVGILICFLLMALAWAAGYERGKDDHGIKCNPHGKCAVCEKPTFNPTMTWEDGKLAYLPAPTHCTDCKD